MAPLYRSRRFADHENQVCLHNEQSFLGSTPPVLAVRSAALVVLRTSSLQQDPHELYRPACMVSHQVLPLPRARHSKRWLHTGHSLGEGHRSRSCLPPSTDSRTSMAGRLSLGSRTHVNQHLADSEECQRCCESDSVDEYGW